MDESKVTRYATEKYVDKNNINDSEIDEVFDELSMRPRKRYKINYDYDKSACTLYPAPLYIYGDEEASIAVVESERYTLESITVLQGKDDITNNVVSSDKGFIKLKSINNDINIKIISSLNGLS